MGDLDVLFGFFVAVIEFFCTMSFRLFFHIQKHYIQKIIEETYM